VLRVVIFFLPRMDGAAGDGAVWSWQRWRKHLEEFLPHHRMRAERRALHSSLLWRNPPQAASTIPLWPTLPQLITVGIQEYLDTKY
jgi:hypothetical protein